jgi:hypothetical protein
VDHTTSARQSDALHIAEKRHSRPICSFPYNGGAAAPLLGAGGNVGVLYQQHSKPVGPSDNTERCGFYDDEIEQLHDCDPAPVYNQTTVTEQQKAILQYTCRTSEMPCLTGTRAVAFETCSCISETNRDSL